MQTAAKSSANIVIADDRLPIRASSVAVGKSPLQTVSLRMNTGNGHAIANRGPSNSERTDNDEDRPPNIPDGTLPRDATSGPFNLSNNIHGIRRKTRVFGEGHWMSSLRLTFQNSIVGTVADYQKTPFQQANRVYQSPLSQQMVRCKELAREIKKQLPIPNTT